MESTTSSTLPERNPAATPPRKFTTSDCLNQGHNQEPTAETSGLNVIAQQKFDLPYDELSPRLQGFVREEAVRRAGNDMLAALKLVWGNRDRHNFSEAERNWIQSAIALAEGK